MPPIVKLIVEPSEDVLDLMSHAARTCYEETEPEWGSKILDIQNKIFGTGHHSLMQHPNFLFFIEGIAISMITLGLHLNMPFYTSSQRSGRFCFGMFSNPDITQGIIADIRLFFPQTNDTTIGKIENYISNSLAIFNQNLNPATEIAKQFIAQERPRAQANYIKQNARKFAQEQLRTVIPTIFPTALVFTINLSALVALYRSAWDPPMRHITDLMAQEVLELHPELKYMFTREEGSSDDISSLDLALTIPTSCILKDNPALKLLSMDVLDGAVYPETADIHPVDKLPFDPKFMPNNVIDILTKVEISLATMGQDQRHKQIRRGPFDFTGGFYNPPIVDMLDIDGDLLRVTEMWLELSSTVHPALFRLLAPYGAMVSYEKKGNLNAVMHEQDKRLCWCTQQEIYDIARQLREAISHHPECSNQLLSMLSPKCFARRQCGEGKRYCGRDLRGSPADFFPKRLV